MQSPQGMQGFRGRLGEKILECGHCLLVNAIDKKTLGSQAPEHVIMAQGIDQFFPRSIDQIKGRGIVPFVNKTVDPPMLTVAVRVEAQAWESLSRAA